MIPERAAGRILGAALVDLAGQFGGLGPGGGIVDLVGLAVAEPGELAPVQHFVGAVLNDAADGVRKVLRGDAVHHHVGHRDLAFVRLAARFEVDVAGEAGECLAQLVRRSEESSVGTECVGTWSSWWSTYS